MTRIKAVTFLVILLPILVHAETTPVNVVKSFHSALREGDYKLVKQLLDPKVVVYEEGVAELSFSDYELYHLKSDMEFAGSTSRRVINTRVIDNQNVAAVLSIGIIKGIFKNKKVYQNFSETMLLKYGDNNWRITHIHWSNNIIENDNILMPDKDSLDSIIDNVINFIYSVQFKG